MIKKWSGGLQCIMDKKILGFVFGFVVIFSFGFVFAEDVYEEDVSFCSELAEEGFSCGSNLDFKVSGGTAEYVGSDVISIHPGLLFNFARVKVIEKVDGDFKTILFRASCGSYDFSERKYFFSNLGCKFKIDDFLLEGILPFYEGRNSFVQFDLNNTLSRIDFVTAENWVNFTLNGILFKIPPSSRFVYDSKDKLNGGYVLPKDAIVEDVNLDFLKDLFGDDLFGSPNLKFSGEGVVLKGFEDGDDIILNGDARVVDEGYFIEEGSVISYNGRDLSMPNGGSFLLADSNSDMLDYDGSYVQETSDKLIVKAEDSDIFVSFSEDDDLVNIGENDFLTVSANNGKKLEILRRDGSSPIRILQNFSEGGSVFSSGLEDVIFTPDNIYSESSSLTSEGVLSGRYRPVDINIEDVDRSVKFDKIGVITLEDEVGPSMIYDASDNNYLLNNFNHNELTNIILTPGYSENGDYSTMNEFIANGYLNDFFSSTEKSKLSNDESISVFNSVGKFSENANENEDRKEIIYHFGEMVELLEGNSGSKIHDFVLDVSDSLENETFKKKLYSLEGVNKNIIPFSKEKSIDISTTRDFTSKVLSSPRVDFPQNPRMVSYTLNEYDGENFEEIRGGLLRAKDYGFQDSMVSVINNTSFEFSKINDDEDFSYQFSKSINDNIEKLKSDSSFSSNAISSIYLLRGSDESIKDQVISNIDDEQKYYLLVNSDVRENEVVKDFYYSLDKNFPSDLRKMDKSLDETFDFFEIVSSELSFDEMVENNPEYERLFFESINESFFLGENISQKIPRILNIRSSYSENSFNSEGVQNYFKFLNDGFENSKNSQERAAYVYLLQNEEESFKRRDILEDFYPSVVENYIPDKLVDRDVVASKLYFYNDEWSYENTRKFLEEKGFKVVSERIDVPHYIDYGGVENPGWADVERTRGKGEAVLEKVLSNGKVLRVSTELLEVEKINIYGGGKSPDNIKEVVESDEYAHVGYRGHCFYSQNIFGDVSSDSEKIIQDGSCYSGKLHGEKIKNFPNSKVISDRNSGEGAVSDVFLVQLLENMGEGIQDWNKIVSDGRYDFSQKGYLYSDLNRIVDFESWYQNNKESFNM